MMDLPYICESMSYYEHIQLTLEETIKAIEEGRRKKYFHEKNKDYWEQQEKQAIERAEEDKRIAKLKRASLRSQVQTLPEEH